MMIIKVTHDNDKVSVYDAQAIHVNKLIDNTADVNISLISGKNVVFHMYKFGPNKIKIIQAPVGEVRL